MQGRYRIDALLADHGGDEKGQVLFLPYLYAQNSQATLLRCQSTPCTRWPDEYPIEHQKMRVLLNEPNDTDAKTASLKHVELFQDVWYRASISVDDIAQDPRLEGSSCEACSRKRNQKKTYKIRACDELGKVWIPWKA